MYDLLESLVKRVTSIERRLDDHVKFNYNCNINEDDNLFMEINLKKRLPNYLVRSASETNFITDDDLQNITAIFRASIAHVKMKGYLNISIHTLEQHDWYDACLKLNVRLSRVLSKNDKVTLYESIERTLKMRLGDLYEITPVFSNKYVGYRLFRKEIFPL